MGLAAIILLMPIPCLFMTPTYYDVFGEPMPVGTIFLICFISGFVLFCGGVMFLTLNYERV